MSEIKRIYSDDEIKVQDLLKKLYKGKSLEQMSEKEVDRMLEDLI